MRIWGHVLVGGMVALCSPLGMTAAGATPSHPGGVTDTCPEVLAGAPTGAAHKRTDPPPGSDIARGTVIDVTLQWNPAQFTGPLLHKVLDCVTVDGKPADDLSVQERDPANDGEFTTRMTVPDGLADGARLCDRGFVSGPTPSGGFAREKTNDVCFTIRVDTVAAPPTLSETTTPLVSVPSPQAEVSPPVEVELAGGTAAPTDTGVDRAGGGPVGTSIAGAGDRRDQQQRTTLPRTGTGVASTFLVALLLVVSGQVARYGGRRRA